jgi:hypothetical protein
MLSGCMSRFQPADIQGRRQSSGKAHWSPSAGADIIAAGREGRIRDAEPLHGWMSK